MAKVRVLRRRGRRSGGRRKYRANKRGWFRSRAGYRGTRSRRQGRRRLYSHPTKATVRSRRRRRRTFANPPRSRRRRHYRRNGPRRRSYRHGNRRRVMDNPAAGAMNIFKDMFSVDTVKSMVLGLLGFGTALALPQMVLSQVELYRTQPIVRVLAPLVVTGLAAALVGFVTKDKNMIKTTLTGGLVATGWRALSEVVPAEKKPTFPIPLLAGMGDAQSEAFRKAIEGEILKQLNAEGVSGYLTPGQVENAVRQGGMSAYLTPGQVERATGMGARDEFSPRAMAERF